MGDDWVPPLEPESVLLGREETRSLFAPSRVQFWTGCAAVLRGTPKREAVSRTVSRNCRMRSHWVRFGAGVRL